MANTLITRRTLLMGASCLAAVSLVGRAEAADEGVAIIVNPKNAQKSVDASELAAIFTTRTQFWNQGGGRILAFNFPAKHPVRVAFDDTVIHMDADQVARFWIDRRVRGGNPPPRQVPNGPLLLRLVEELEGAIGYVPESLVSPKVRVVGAVKNGKLELK